ASTRPSSGGDRRAVGPACRPPARGRAARADILSGRAPRAERGASGSSRRAPRVSPVASLLRQFAARAVARRAELLAGPERAHPLLPHLFEPCLERYLLVGGQLAPG